MSLFNIFLPSKLSKYEKEQKRMYKKYVKAQKQDTNEREKSESEVYEDSLERQRSERNSKRRPTREELIFKEPNNGLGLGPAPALLEACNRYVVVGEIPIEVLGITPQDFRINKPKLYVQENRIRNTNTHHEVYQNVPNDVRISDSDYEVRLRPKRNEDIPKWYKEGVNGELNSSTQRKSQWQDRVYANVCPISTNTPIVPPRRRSKIKSEIKTENLILLEDNQLTNHIISNHPNVFSESERGNITSKEDASNFGNFDLASPVDSIGRTPLEEVSLNEDEKQPLGSASMSTADSDSFFDCLTEEDENNQSLMLERIESITNHQHNKDKSWDEQENIEEVDATSHIKNTLEIMEDIKYVPEQSIPMDSKVNSKTTSERSSKSHIEDTFISSESEEEFNIIQSKDASTLHNHFIDSSFLEQTFEKESTMIDSEEEKIPSDNQKNPPESTNKDTLYQPKEDLKIEHNFGEELRFSSSSASSEKDNDFFSFQYIPGRSNDEKDVEYYDDSEQKLENAHTNENENKNPFVEDLKENFENYCDDDMFISSESEEELKNLKNNHAQSFNKYVEKPKRQSENLVITREKIKFDDHGETNASLNEPPEVPKVLHLKDFRAKSGYSDSSSSSPEEAVFLDDSFKFIPGRTSDIDGLKHYDEKLEEYYSSSEDDIFEPRKNDKRKVNFDFANSYCTTYERQSSASTEMSDEDDHRHSADNFMSLIYSSDDMYNQKDEVYKNFGVGGSNKREERKLKPIYENDKMDLAVLNCQNGYNEYEPQKSVEEVTHFNDDDDYDVNHLESSKDDEHTEEELDQLSDEFSLDFDEDAANRFQNYFDNIGNFKRGEKVEGEKEALNIADLQLQLSEVQKLDDVVVQIDQIQEVLNIITTQIEMLDSKESENYGILLKTLLSSMKVLGNLNCNFDEELLKFQEETLGKIRNCIKSLQNM